MQALNKGFTYTGIAAKCDEVGIVKTYSGLWAKRDGSCNKAGTEHVESHIDRRARLCAARGKYACN